MAELSPQAREQMRHNHRTSSVNGLCVKCKWLGPCDVLDALDTLAEMEGENERLREEARYWKDRERVMADALDKITADLSGGWR